jgi:hypothetical protein
VSFNSSYRLPVGFRHCPDAPELVVVVWCLARYHTGAIRDGVLLSVG